MLRRWWQSSHLTMCFVSNGELLHKVDVESWERQGAIVVQAGPMLGDSESFADRVYVRWGGHVQYKAAQPAARWFVQVVCDVNQ